MEISPQQHLQQLQQLQQQNPQQFNSLFKQFQLQPMDIQKTDVQPQPQPQPEFMDIQKPDVHLPPQLQPHTIELAQQPTLTKKIKTVEQPPLPQQPQLEFMDVQKPDVHLPPQLPLAPHTIELAQQPTSTKKIKTVEVQPDQQFLPPLPQHTIELEPQPTSTKKIKTEEAEQQVSRKRRIDDDDVAIKKAKTDIKFEEWMAQEKLKDNKEEYLLSFYDSDNVENAKVKQNQQQKFAQKFAQQFLSWSPISVAIKFYPQLAINWFQQGKITNPNNKILIKSPQQMF